MNAISDRYEGKKTPKGHRLRVTEHDDALTVWYLYWGELAGADDHHHIGIARVQRAENGFTVGWFAGLEQEPCRTETHDDIESVFAAIDAAIDDR